MKKVVVDTSVAVKWFVPEIHAEAAGRLLESDVVFCAPDLIGPELANAIWQKVRRGDLTREEADEILATFDGLAIEMVPSKGLLAPAFKIAAMLDRTVYDSLFVALAVVQDCPLVTADRKFHSAVLTSATLAPHVRWVEDEP